MTKTELHNKYPILLTPEGTQMMHDVSSYLRLGTFLLRPDAAIDESNAVRRSGWLDGYLGAANAVYGVPTPEVQPQPSGKNEVYSEPQNKVSDEKRPPHAPPVDMTRFIKTEEKK